MSTWFSVLAQSLQSTPARPEGPAGTLEFCVGVLEPTYWRVTLGQPAHRVEALDDAPSENLPDGRSVRVFCSVEQLDAMVKGDLPEALRCEGDVSLLNDLASLISGSHSPISVRL